MLVNHEINWVLQLIFYGYCGSNVDDAIAIDDIVVESTLTTTTESATDQVTNTPQTTTSTTTPPTTPTTSTTVQGN